MLVLGHAGHWAVQLLYAAPIALIAAALMWSTVRDRRLGRDADADDEARELSLDDVLDGKR